MDREPAVAGRFYTDEPEALARELDGFLAVAAGRMATKGIVAPHAGYVYSGAIAGAVYARVAVPRQVIVLVPNHTGLGRPAALWPAGGGWRTPLGRVPVSAALTEALAAGPGVEIDRAAHLREHSLEVHLPFLQRSRPDVEIAALCLGPLDVSACEAIGRTVAATTSPPTRPARRTASPSTGSWRSIRRGSTGQCGARRSACAASSRRP